MLRCVGRLGNLDLNEYARKPFILPGEHRFTTLVIDDCHTRVHHSGLRGTLAELRSGKSKVLGAKGETNC
jgi:hypothetical protein